MLDAASDLPRVSVVIPCYQAAWSVGRTLSSVFAQRFSSFEVILVDDGSTDALNDAISPWTDRIKVIRQENQGLAVARNRGIQAARAALVAPIDADDLWHPNFLAELVFALEQHPGVPFAFAQSFRIDEQDHILPEVVLPRPPRHDFTGLVSLNSVGNGSAAVIRRTSLLAAGGYDASLLNRAAQGAEDWKLFVQLSAQGQPMLIPRRLVAYRLTQHGMSQHRPQQQLAAVEAVIDDLAKEFPLAPAQLFRDARTMMIAWLLPAFLRKRMFGCALWQACRGYAFNTSWWRNPELRLVHSARLMMVLTARLGHAGPLRDWTEDGERPFSFLPA